MSLHINFVHQSNVLYVPFTYYTFFLLFMLSVTITYLNVLYVYLDGKTLQIYFPTGRSLSEYCERITHTCTGALTSTVSG